MRRQQYRFTPKLSKTLPESSPCFTLLAKSSHLSPIKLPQVKQRTGMMIEFTSVAPNTHMAFSLTSSIN